MDSFQITYLPDTLGFEKDCRAMKRHKVPFTELVMIWIPLFSTFIYVIVGILVAPWIAIYLKISIYYVFGLFYITSVILFSRILRPYFLARVIDRIDAREPPRQTSLTADADGIVVANNLSRLEFRWPAIRDVKQFRHGVGVVTSGLSIHIPNSAFADAAQRASLIALAKDYLEPRQAQSQA